MGDAATIKQTLSQLDTKRKSLEMEGEAIISELMTKPESGGEPMGIDTPLVDREGYPRADIDVYRARDLRHRLAVIKTDRAELMKQIDQLLQQLALIQNPRKLEEEKKELDSRRAPKPKPKYDPETGKWVVKNWDGTISGVANGQTRTFENLSSNLAAASIHSTANNTQAQTLFPFAKVNAVASGSPASEAGLQEGDLILQFGSIDYSNHQNLTALGPIVASAADAQKAISIQLLRPEGDTKVNVQVELVPKPWPGRGLIGCHILPSSALS